jgi:lysophospholipase L1-like esterase
MKKKLLLSLSALFISLLILLIGMELIARLLIKNEYTFDEINIVYRYDEELGWFPIENTSKEFTGTRLIHVKSNTDGFRDAEHGTKKKKRIAFLGDSFVWGYDVEYGERFTEYLQQRMPDWEIINMGVSGYSTDQELILIKKWFDHYEPDIVFLVFCDNDWLGNRTNKMYNYYKSYFSFTGDKLIEHGAPIEKSTRYFITKYPILMRSRLVQYIIEITRPKTIYVKDPATALVEEINTFIESKGARFYIAFTNDNGMADHSELCKIRNIPYLLLTNEFRYQKNGYHWTPEGHEFVSNKIYKFLSRQDSLSGLFGTQRASLNSTNEK